jgi:isopenicillin-N epimerase
MSTAPQPFPASIRDLWMLNPKVAFLNHGSFGAVPRPVFDAQDEWRLRLERDPIELIGRKCRGMLDGVKEAVGGVLGMRADDFGLVTNATEGINAVLRSYPLKMGDELLTTNHVYNAVRQAMKFAAGRVGATYRELEIGLPIASSKQIEEAVLSGISEKTRLLVIDHVSSPTATIFPIRQIIAACNEQGVDVLVDGAHAPGMMELDIANLGAAFYAGNLHKWCCCPKGSAFLHVRADRQGSIHPNVISHDLGKGLVAEFNWQGTRDLSSWLTIPTALEFMASLGWEKVRGHNHAMVAWGQEMLCGMWGVESVYGEEALFGAMATLRTPAGLGRHVFEEVQQRLYTEFGVEAPIVDWGGVRHTRISAQVYNVPGDYERLGEAVVRLAEG